MPYVHFIPKFTMVNIFFYIRILFSWVIWGGFFSQWKSSFTNGTEFSLR